MDDHKISPPFFPGKRGVNSIDKKEGCIHSKVKPFWNEDLLQVLSKNWHLITTENSAALTAVSDIDRKSSLGEL